MLSPMTFRGAALWLGIAMVIVLVVAWFAGALDSPAPTPVAIEDEVVSPPPGEPEPAPPSGY
jgi:hypothetical protein